MDRHDPQAALRRELRRRRRALGLTQIEVAERLGMTRRAYHLKESAQGWIKPPLIERLAAFYGCAVEELWPPAARFLVEDEPSSASDATAKADSPYRLISTPAGSPR